MPIQLEAGHELSVIIDDAAGHSAQSWIELPPGAPVNHATSSGAGPTPGMVMLTLTSPFGGPKLEEAVDANGVPVYVHQALNPEDLKLQPNGDYSVARGKTDQLNSSFDIVELDHQFRPVASYNTVDLTDTEFHDSILLRSGGRILMAYEPNATTGEIDSVVQEVRPDGTVSLTWNSADHTVPSDRLTPLKDYAHMNSIDVMNDGNLLLSFRHLSQVMRIDRTTGDVIWRSVGSAQLHLPR